MQGEDADVVVIGGGIAGASVAAELSADARVFLIEQETQPGYHATGRSAALFTTAYGPSTIRALSRASAGFFAAAHSGLDHALTRPRGVLFIARADQAAAMAALRAEMAGAVAPVSPAAARDRVPLLRPEAVAEAMEEPGAADIDVESLHRLFLRRLAAAGGRLVTGNEVMELARDGARWRIETPASTLRAAVVVNAAGAWADVIAGRAGVRPLGLTPKRRTAVLVDLPAGIDASNWPMVLDVQERFYARPDAARLLLSPADATPSAPCDARPEELDVAICIDRVQRALDLPVRRIAHAWAGLRSFLADGVPVAGFAADAPGFFWLAGQGGYGIQTAPALARTAAALVLGRSLPADVAAEGVEAAALAADRPGLAV